MDGLISEHRRPRTSLIAVHMDGRREEPFLFEGTCDTAVFNAWLKTRLCPRLTCEHLVIMDNSASHKSPETAYLIEHTGATLLFLLPYSPDLTPPLSTPSLHSRNTGNIRKSLPSTRS